MFNANPRRISAQGATMTPTDKEFEAALKDLEEMASQLSDEMFCEHDLGPPLATVIRSYVTQKDAQIEQLKKENEELRAVQYAAFEAGFDACDDGIDGGTTRWGFDRKPYLDREWEAFKQRKP